MKLMVIFRNDGSLIRRQDSPSYRLMFINPYSRADGETKVTVLIA